MRAVYRFAALTLLVWPALAGDVSLQVQITRRLTKKSVAPTVYNLRGAVPTAVAPDPDLLSEFDRTVVMLEGRKTTAGDPQTITIEQRNSRFEPDLAVVPIGSTARFPNEDPIFHNVFSLSRTQPFDLGFFPKSQSRSVKFDRAGVVQIYCHIHASMYAAVVVTGSPWFGKPGATGEITWANVPEGHYRALAWHKIAGLYHAEVDVPASGTAKVVIRVPVDSEHRP